MAYETVKWWDPGTSSKTPSNNFVQSGAAAYQNWQAQNAGSIANNARVAALGNVGANPGINPAAASPGTTGVPYGDLANSVNTFMAGQAKNQFQLNQPNYDSNTNAFSLNTADNLAGRLTRGETNNIWQQAAERGIITGNSNGLLNVLNKTNERQQQGAANLHQLNADTPISPTWNPMSLYVPQTLAAQELSAAQSGLNQGSSLGGGTRGGGGGGTITGMPNLSMPSTPFAPTFGGQFTAYGSGSGHTPYLGGATQYGNTVGSGSSYNQGGYFGGSDFSDPYDPGFWASDVGGNTGNYGISDQDWEELLYGQTVPDEMPHNYIPGQGGVTDWNQYGNIDWSMYE